MSSTLSGWNLETPLLRRLLRTDHEYPHRFNVPSDALEELAADRHAAVRELSRLVVDDRWRSHHGRMYFALCELAVRFLDLRPSIFPALMDPSVCINTDDRCVVICDIDECPPEYVPQLVSWLDAGDWHLSRRAALALSHAGTAGQAILCEAVRGGRTKQNEARFIYACYAIGKRVQAGNLYQTFLPLLPLLIDDLPNYLTHVQEETAYGPRAVGAFGAAAWPFLFAKAEQPEYKRGVAMALACHGNIKGVIAVHGGDGPAAQEVIANAVHLMAEPRCRPHESEAAYRPLGNDAGFVFHWLLDLALLLPPGPRNALRYAALTAAYDTRASRIGPDAITLALPKIARLLHGSSAQERELVLLIGEAASKTLAPLDNQVLEAAVLCRTATHRQNAAYALASRLKVDHGEAYGGGKTFTFAARRKSLAGLQAAAASPEADPGTQEFLTALAAVCSMTLARDEAIVALLSDKPASSKS